MKARAMAIGAMLLVVLGAGCAKQSEYTGASALVGPADSRPDVSRLRVTVDLGEIVIP
jgi:hypothetical protein